MKANARLSLVGLIALAAAFISGPATAQASFGLTESSVSITAENVESQLLAGAHPSATSVSFGLQTVEEGTHIFPDEAVKDVFSNLPAGFAADPTAAPRCSAEQFKTLSAALVPACPDAAAVGVASVRLAIDRGAEPVQFNAAIYNLAPVPGTVLRLGFVVDRVPVIITGGLSQKPPYNAIGASTNISQVVSFFAARVTLWGDPANASHDSLRGSCTDATKTGPISSTGQCPVEGAEKPFLTLPTSCTIPLQSKFEADSWQHPGPPYSSQNTVVVQDSNGNPGIVEGCAGLNFAPRTDVQTSTPAAESPAGLDFDLDVDNKGLTEASGRADSSIEKAIVTLPEGVTTNPAVASGLGACGLAEYESETLASDLGTGCPESSKIGSVEVETPLLEKEASEGGGLTVLPGSIYVARQHDNPFDNLLTIYMVIKDPQLGILIKLPGKVEPNATTGQLKTTFGEPGYELPQLPFSHFHLHFRSGSRAPLITPPTCGTYTTQALLYPYAAPSSPSAQTAAFTISAGANGSGCVASRGQLPNRPAFTAGTLSPVAGSYSPFVLNLSRDDGSQQFSSISTTLPQGLLGRLAGIPYCSDADIARAAAMGGEGQGAVEKAAPSCPSASEVGTVTVGAGAGPEPLYVSGHAYLAGPYKGAPLSLEIVTPAIAGPFDLGVVAVRTALQVDPVTAQITAVSDPLPTILHGLPLDIRSIAVDLERPGFTLNPTSCEPKQITGFVTSTLMTVTPLSQYFQAAGCGALGFKPKLALALKGKTTRGKDPALKAVLTYPKRGAYSNIAKVSTVLPKSEFIDNRHINNPCTRVQFNAGVGDGAQCPRASILGKATAYSPLLEKPLAGPVYFRSNGGERELPDLVVALRGQINVNLVGFIDSVGKKGSEISRTRTTFANVPDAQVSRFVLELKGGRKGLLQNSANLCKVKNVAQVKATAQNGKTYEGTPTVANSCSRSRGKKK